MRSSLFVCFFDAIVILFAQLHPNFYVCRSKGGVVKRDDAKGIKGLGAFIGIAFLNIHGVNGNAGFLCPITEGGECGGVGIQRAGMIGTQNDRAVMLQIVRIAVCGMKLNGENAGVLRKFCGDLLAGGEFTDHADSLGVFLRIFLAVNAEHGIVRLQMIDSGKGIVKFDGAALVLIGDKHTRSVLSADKVNGGFEVCIAVGAGIVQRKVGGYQDRGNTVVARGIGQCRRGKLQGIGSVGDDDSVVVLLQGGDDPLGQDLQRFGGQIFTQNREGGIGFKFDFFSVIFFKIVDQCITGGGIGRDPAVCDGASDGSAGKNYQNFHR